MLPRMRAPFRGWCDHCLLPDGYIRMKTWKQSHESIPRLVWEIISGVEIQLGSGANERNLYVSALVAETFL